MITFQTGLDLTDTNIQTFLQSLPNSFSLENGYINFSPTGIGSLMNVPADITFWLHETLPPFIGDGNAADFLTTKNDNGDILSGINLDGVFGNDGLMSCSAGE